MEFILTRKQTLKLLREKTGGYIGKLDQLLREAAIRALCKGLTKIDLETLKEVAAGLWVRRSCGRGCLLLRLRRANTLSRAELGRLSRLGGVLVGRLEQFYLNPPPTTDQLQSLADCLGLTHATDSSVAVVADDAQAAVSLTRSSSFLTARSCNVVMPRITA